MSTDQTYKSEYYRKKFTPVPQITFLECVAEGSVIVGYFKYSTDNDCEPNLNNVVPRLRASATLVKEEKLSTFSSILYRKCEFKTVALTFGVPVCPWIKSINVIIK